ncbi:MAG: hypothetical protein ABJ092_07760 [Gillisia sp.]
MEILPNLKFEYLHRDEGNYKIYGVVIFRNPENITIAEAEASIKANLIDQQYFYPKEMKIPLFNQHSEIGVYFTDWYEYWQISVTNEKSSEPRTIKAFIKDLEKVCS